MWERNFRRKNWQRLLVVSGEGGARTVVVREGESGADVFPPGGTCRYAMFPRDLWEGEGFVVWERNSSWRGLLVNGSVSGRTTYPESPHAPIPRVMSGVFPLFNVAGFVLLRRRYDHDPQAFALGGCVYHSPSGTTVRSETVPRLLRRVDLLGES